LEAAVRSGPRIITLLTDFGTRDAYVACLKGVILGLNPQARLVDLTHEVPPQDIRGGAFVLKAAAPFFPPGTIHLAVVDPAAGPWPSGPGASSGWGRTMACSSSF
jgi:S-adenosylmethionine hydrolase